MIVAWHEVPGKPATAVPSRRVRRDLRLHQKTVSRRHGWSSELGISGIGSNRTLRDGFIVAHFQALRAKLISLSPSGTDITY